MTMDDDSAGKPPPSYFKVSDGTQSPKTSYFCLVLRRGKSLHSVIPLWRWSWLCFIEALFGEELLENLVTTSSLSGCPENRDEERSYGHPRQLSLHVPNGLLSNRLRSQLIEVLYYKFYLRYGLILPVVEPYINPENKEINVSDVRFAFRKSLLWQVISFRRVYLAEALAFNLAIDFMVLLFTNSLFYAAIAAVGVESLRRLMKI